LLAAGLENVRLGCSAAANTHNVHVADSDEDDDEASKEG
jgi:hypothetical protein